MKNKTVMKEKIVMKRFIILLSLFALVAMPFAYAEEDPALVRVVEMLQENLNLSNKPFSHYVDISGNDTSDYFYIDFDWRDGNETIRAMCGYAARAYSTYPVDTLEKVQCLLYFLKHYEKIEKMLPKDVELTFRIWEADGNKIEITANNYKSYLKKYQKALGK